MVKRFLDGSYAAGGQFFVATTLAKTAAKTATPSMFNPQMWHGWHLQERGPPSYEVVITAANPMKKTCL